MIDFKLPSLGADMDEGTLLTWYIKPGDPVKRGQVVAVVDTSKAAVDVEIWHDGVVHELRVQPGEKVPVDTVLATVLETGEAAPAPEADAVLRAPATVMAPRRVPAPVCAARHLVSPAARRRARELGLDPETVRGTGATGAVTLADIEAAAPRLAAAVSIAVPPRPPVAPAPVIALDRRQDMRRAIAAAMSRSKRDIPHYYLSETIPMAAALAWLQAHNTDRPITERVLPAALLLKAVALALHHTPELNGFYRDGQFEPSAAVHLGVAISLRGGGLVAPALHDVANQPLAPLMQALADLVKRARAGTLRSSEMSDPTITVTNLGDQGVEAVFGVIYPPQVALVGFGQVVARPWVLDGQLGVQPVVCATLSADHRASDGHRGALFLAALRDLLQQPQTLDAAGPPLVTPKENHHEL
jgi:pyruvate dehydrogenase E2 component (dihydrolipoamide acetyltransferase)